MRTIYDVQATKRDNLKHTEETPNDSRLANVSTVIRLRSAFIQDHSVK